VSASLADLDVVHRRPVPAGGLSVPRRRLEVMRPVTDLERRVAPFKVVSDYQPSGDQPTAIDDIERRIEAGEKDVVLLGATGTGKTATVAWAVERLQRPTLVLQPNKTLAAQFANELRQLFPDNAVEYFVSYYDYYQPEAYVPQTDTYIEKDSSINEEVERLRHSATNSLLTRRDVIVVSTVSCIYGLGTPQEYVDRMVRLKVGDEHDRDSVLRRLVEIQYTRNDMAFTRGTFRVRGDTLEVFPVYEELAVRVEFFGDEVERLMTLHPVTGEVVTEDEELYIFPATHYVAGPERMERAIKGIELELEDQLATFEKQGKLLEAQRLRMRTTYDVEMMRQVGSCSGIENYSMHIDGRKPGSAPNCLLDYFPEDFLLVVDESHVAVPQVGGMYEGDMSRKRNLVDHGFRLPSAMDNRPLKWEEFLDRIGQTIYLSATPGNYEMSKVGGPDNVVEQIIRPTGLVDPEVVVKGTKGQIDDLIHQINERVEKNERVLVTTLTKKMSEDLTDYLLEAGIRTRYLHSEVDTLRRVELLRELRMGEYDVLVGINLLREGLDLPEVSLVAILDADKEGFLRSDKSLIQTIGRAARNVSGQVIMYADKVTPSMENAIEETNRRRDKQIAYNVANGVDPQPLRKKIADITEMLAREDESTEELLRTWQKAGGEGKGKKAPVPGLSREAGKHAAELAGLPSQDLADLVQQLTEQMHAAAAELQFELAARLRDEISELKKELRQMVEAGAR
jgi:excinuclease ABC subunit B